MISADNGNPRVSIVAVDASIAVTGALRNLANEARLLQEVAAVTLPGFFAHWNKNANAASEFENLARLSQGAAAGVQFGVDREGALSKILKLQERLEHMQEVRHACI